jgi:hypothetical protein
MKTAIVYVGAAVAEIAGCFAFWSWLRLGKPLWWLLPGVFSLILFAYLLTLVSCAWGKLKKPPPINGFYGSAARSRGLLGPSFRAAPGRA